MASFNSREKIEALEKILGSDSTGLDRVESTVVLLRGYHPQVDKKLAQVARHLGTIRNLQEGNVVELSVERLPDGTQKEKRRKRAILFLLKSLRELKGEIERVKRELDRSEKGEQSGAESFGKIASFAKGPFGIITIGALVAAGGFLLVRGKTSQNQVVSVGPTPVAVTSPSPLAAQSPSPSPRVTPSLRPRIRVILYNGRAIPLFELEVVTGPDCTNSPTEAAHYHAKNGQSVRSIDGTVIADPGGCAFGKVDGTQVQETEAPSSLQDQYKWNQDQGALQ